MPNAVSELALLNSSFAIPPEFRPDDSRKRADGDQYPPRWELVLDPGTDLDEEELWEQRLEYWTELLRQQEEERRPYLSSNVFRDEDGIYVMPFRQPDAKTIAVAAASNFRPYVYGIKTPDHLSANPQFGGKVPFFRVPSRRTQIRKEARDFDAHG